MRDLWSLQLYPGTTLETQDGSVVVQGPGGGLRWSGPSPARVSAVDRLIGGARLSTLVEAVEAEGGPVEGARLRMMLQQLNANGGLLVGLEDEGTRLLTAVPMTPEPIAARPIPGPLRLSRFASVHREGDQALLTSPRSHLRMVLHDAGLTGWLLGSTELDAEGRSPAWSAVLELLHGGGLLVPVEDDPEQQGALACWEPHDLRFHVHSRRGRHDHVAGATFRFRDQLPPWPALAKPRPGAEIVPLPSVELASVRARDPALTTVIESRCSTREHGPEPIAVAALAELLYRTHRVRRQEHATEDRPYDTAWRPYPGGGACYELELYPVVRRCDGLEPGVYRYLADQHALETIASVDADVEQLWVDARSATPAEGLPQVLLVITARFPRMSWKYESMAYCATLKNAGVLLQTVYLVATAMGLAVSALGTGNTDAFGRVAGLDPYEEGSVAEMILGLPPPQITP